MTFILFETGSAKWLKSSGLGKLVFTSNMDEATPYSSVWTLEDAIHNIGADRYKDTIVAHSLAGKPIRVKPNHSDVTVKVPIVTTNDLIE